MNRYVQDKWSWIEGSHFMRTQLLDVLSDAELAFSPGGDTMTLGALFRELGDVERSYNASLKTFRQDWSQRTTDAELESSVARLKAWFQPMDDEMKATIETFSDNDLLTPVDRGNGNSLPVESQLDAYLQAVLIFFGKATIYLRVMKKPLPDAFGEYIG